MCVGHPRQSERRLMLRGLVGLVLGSWFLIGCQGRLSGYGYLHSLSKAFSCRAIRPLIHVSLRGLSEYSLVLVPDNFGSPDNGEKS